ncbi:MAG: HAMP domain-containing histidine kinase [Clostridiales bacterium]|nr:HAMP domain-containing histidine kinase [Clostridiales bacterium]
MNAKEIQKLRRKFILIASVSFLLVTVFIGSLINAANYIVTQTEINWTLDRISESQDAFDKETEPRRPPSSFSVVEIFSPAYQRNNFYQITYDESGEEASYFSGNGNIMSKESVTAAAEEIQKLQKQQGRYEQYSFKLTENSDGTTSLVMLDIGIVLYARLRLAYASVAVGLIGMLITVILVVAMSKKVVKPEIENSLRQEQFLTNVSHELKTPLAVIRSNTEMQELTGAESEWTQSTIRQVDRMNSLIQNLVMITKSREMESKSGTEKINVSQAVSQTAQDFVSRAESEGKALKQQIEPDLELTTDGSKIRQLTMLLLDNAVKYCDENGAVDIALEPLAKRGKKGVRLTVSNDYAAGKDVDCARFFDRFYREDKSHNIDTGGYGIGLSIAESICTQQNGSIRAAWHNGRISFICELF